MRLLVIDAVTRTGTPCYRGNDGSGARPPSTSPSNAPHVADWNKAPKGRKMELARPVTRGGAHDQINGDFAPDIHVTQRGGRRGSRLQPCGACHPRADP